MIRYAKIVVCEKFTGNNIVLGLSPDFKKTFIKFEIENRIMVKTYNESFWKKFYENP